MTQAGAFSPIAVVALALLALGLGAATLVWHYGTRLTSPAPSRIGTPPDGLGLAETEFVAPTATLVRGWYLPGQPGAPALVLLHGKGGNRTSMLGRARFLNRAGYAVLLIDFRGHGESEGNRYTFGYLEAFDAKAALAYARSRNPGVKVGAIGFSLGAAACVLGEAPAQFDALVLEALYPSIEEAIGNRIAIALGRWATPLHPLLSWQIEPRLGISPTMLRPIAKIGAITAPLLIIAGAEDAHVTLAQSQRLFDQAIPPKQFWTVRGAGHEDYYRFAPRDYERTVLSFLAAHLQ